ILQGKPFRRSAPAENITVSPIFRIGSGTMHLPYLLFPSEVSRETPCAIGLASAVQPGIAPAGAIGELPMANSLINPLLVEPAFTFSSIFITTSPSWYIVVWDRLFLFGRTKGL